MSAEPIWTTRQGKKIPVSEMSSIHILNALKKIGSKDYPWDEYHLSYDALLEEALNRNLDPDGERVEEEGVDEWSKRIKLP